MSPQRRPLDIQRVEESHRFAGCAPVKIGGQFRDLRGPAMARPVWNENPKSPTECRDGAVEGIDLVSPSAMQENERRPGPGVAIVDPSRGVDIEESGFHVRAAAADPAW
jgi:hypothetical protein